MKPIQVTYKGISKVIKSIPDNQIWVGNPAKFIRETTE